MARSGRLVWIKPVLRSVPIYAMVAKSLPPWVRKERLAAFAGSFSRLALTYSVQGEAYGLLADCL